MARHIDTADQAKMIRAALKKAMPAQKFSVRLSRYAGGSSIDVSWVDGPTAKEVDAIVAVFAGGGFDGMQDLAYSKQNWLQADGTVTRAGCDHTGENNLKPSMDAELVQFMGDYVFTRREVSAEFRQAVRDAYAEAAPEVRKEIMGDAWRAARDVRSWQFNTAELVDFGYWTDDVWRTIERQTSQVALAGFRVRSVAEVVAA